MRQRWVFRAFAVLMGLAIALVALEIACRVDGAYPRHLAAVERLRSFESPDLWCGRCTREGGGDVVLELRERPKAKTPVLVILCIGDSFTHGVLLRLEETWPKQLEADLNRRRRADAPRIITVNAGMSGAGLDEAFRLLAAGLSSQRPHLVIHQLFLNDFFDPNDPDAPSYRGPEASSEVVAAPGWNHLRFYCWRAVNTTPVLRGSFNDRVSWFGRPGARHWRASRNKLAKFAERTRAAGVPQLTFLAPAMLWEATLYPFEQFHESIRAAVPDNTDYVDLLPRLIETFSAGRECWVEPYFPETHPDARAHAAFARFLADALEQGGQLDRARAIAMDESR